MPTEQMTKAAYKQLADELEELKGKGRAEIAEAIKHAREFGDISENAEYEAAKNDQALLEQRIAKLEERLRRAEIVNIRKTKGTVAMGSTVSYLDVDNNKEHEFTLVPAVEASPIDGRLSISSPVAQALVGNGVDAEIKVRTPTGVKRMKILRVS